MALHRLIDALKLTDEAQRQPLKLRIGNARTMARLALSDLQKSYCLDDGSFPSAGLQDAAKHINDLLDELDEV